MRTERTPAWWWSRLELVVAIAVTLAIALNMWLAPGPTFWIGNPPMPPWVVLLPIAVYPAAFLVALVGVVWMIRILRGPRDEPRGWRYRDD